MGIKYKIDENPLIEVKGDNMIDDSVVKAKAEAAEEMSVASGMRYKMYAGSLLMRQNVLEPSSMNYHQNEFGDFGMVAESLDEYDEKK